MTHKSVLRREVKDTLARLTSDQRKIKGRKIVQNLNELLKNLKEQNPLPSIPCIGLYAPMSDEVDVLVLLEQVENKKDWRLAFPFGAGQSMSFRQCLPEELEETRQFGVVIRTPSDEAKEVTPDVIIIPGLAFTKKGHRLGRGKGYYDRYLEGFNGPKLGLCFQEQILEEIPHEDHDQFMNYVVSEEGFFHCN